MSNKSFIDFKLLIESKIKQINNFYWQQTLPLERELFRKAFWEYKRPGANYFSVITWKEALDIISDDLDTIDPETGLDSALGLGDIIEIATSSREGVQLLNGGAIRADIKRRPIN